MKRLAALWIAAMMLCCVFMHSPAKAESAVRDGIEVKLTTDRYSYASWETIEASVTIQNHNSFAVKDAVVELSAPEGFRFATENRVEIDQLMPGLQYSFSIRASNPDAPRPVPQTGDSFPLLPAAAGLVFSLSGLLLIRRMGIRRTASLLLCLAVLGGTAQAEIIRKNFKVNCGIQVDEKVAMVTASVHYDFKAVKSASNHGFTSSKPAPTPTPEPLDLSRYIQFPDMVDLNIVEGVTITAEGMPKLKSNQAVYIHANCSFVLTTEDGSAEVPYVLRVGDEVVEEDAPAVIFTEDASAVVTIELQPPGNMPDGIYNGNIEFITETVTNHKAPAQ